MGEVVSNFRLDSLLRPTSIALVGASPKEGSIGYRVALELRRGEFPGEIYFVNPRYEAVLGQPCYPSLEALPAVPEHVVIMLAATRLEQVLEDAARIGVRAATIFDGAYSAQPGASLQAKLRAIAERAGMTLCGSNCVGFLNLNDDVRVSAWSAPHQLRKGGISFISQSGAAFEALVRNDRRLDFNFAVSTGHELTTTAEDYLDFVLSLDSTRAVGLFLESIRSPGAFFAAANKARMRDIPIVVLKVGRSSFSAELAKSHSGAIAGNDAAYKAAFERCGVVQVDDMDEMVATLQLMSQPRRAARGQLISVHDSGGERELIVDMAERLEVPFTSIGAQTEATLRQTLHPSLLPVNPVDVYGDPNDAAGILERSLEALMRDENAALGVVFANVATGFADHEAFIDVCRSVNARIEKPIAVATVVTGTEHGDFPLRMQAAGSPVIFGAANGLKAARNAMRYRDSRSRAASAEIPELEGAAVDRWRQALQHKDALGETASLSILRDVGIAVPRFIHVRDGEALDRAIDAIGLPVVLKTAMPDILHKTEVNGVAVGLDTRERVHAAYRDLSQRLGPDAIVAEMVQGGLEMALGAINDPQFGPLVMVAAGGTAVEIFKDVQYALAPIGLDEARELIGRLKVSPLLRGHRGKPGLDVDGLAGAMVELSRLAHALADDVSEIDVNPVVVRPDGIQALDALIVAMPPASNHTH